MLAVTARLRLDQRSMGSMCYACCDEIPDITVTEALRLVGELFSQILQEVFRVPAAHIQQSIAEFLSHVPSWLREKFMIVTWMS